MALGGYYIPVLHEEMNTEQIDAVFSDVVNIIGELTESANNRLEKLGFDDETYENGSNDEIDHLLEMWDKLKNMSCYC